MSDSICKNNAIRCILCGKFMSYKDLEEGYSEYTPDTCFSCEAIEHTHKKCQEEFEASYK